MNTYKTITSLKNSDERYNFVDENIVMNNIQKLFPTQEAVKFQVIEDGYTNLVFNFTVEGLRYVYRYPGVDTEYINRETEYNANKIASELGLDATLLWSDKSGHKIMKYIVNFRYLEYSIKTDVELIIETFLKLHNSEQLSGQVYDIIGDINTFYVDNFEYNASIFPNMSKLFERVKTIYKEFNYEDRKHVLCHNDIYRTNVLITLDRYYIIDWEYAKDGDPSFDLATFIICSDYSDYEVSRLLKMYLKDDYTQELAYAYYQGFAIASFYWLLWALHVEKNGGDTEGFVDKYYGYLLRFLKIITKQAKALNNPQK